MTILGRGCTKSGSVKKRLRGNRVYEDNYIAILHLKMNCSSLQYFYLSLTTVLTAFLFVLQLPAITLIPPSVYWHDCW